MINSLADPFLGRLLYSSSAVVRGNGQPSSMMARMIASASAPRNAAAGLTGILLHVDNCFIQVLEGPNEELERTFERICCDFRHENIKLIDLTPVRERLFAEWGMACLSEDEDTTIQLRNGLAEVQFLVGVNAREAVNRMRKLIDAQPEAGAAELPAPAVAANYG